MWLINILLTYMKHMHMYAHTKVSQTFLLLDSAGLILVVEVMLWNIKNMGWESTLGSNASSALLPG